MYLYFPKIFISQNNEDWDNALVDVDTSAIRDVLTVEPTGRDYWNCLCADFKIECRTVTYTVVCSCSLYLHYIFYFLKYINIYEYALVWFIQ
jgi:hypothetical protein